MRGILDELGTTTPSLDNFRHLFRTLPNWFNPTVAGMVRRCLEQGHLELLYTDLGGANANTSIDLDNLRSDDMVLIKARSRIPMISGEVFFITRTIYQGTVTRRRDTEVSNPRITLNSIFASDPNDEIVINVRNTAQSNPIRAFNTSFIRSHTSRQTVAVIRADDLWAQPFNTVRPVFDRNRYEHPANLYIKKNPKKKVKLEKLNENELDNIFAAKV